MTALLLPVDAATLLPHRGRMCCIDQLTACREEEGHASVVLRPEHALVDMSGRLDPLGFIELAAQTAGALCGALAHGNRPALAMLAGVQKFTALGPAFVGDVLRISTAVLGELQDMRAFRFAVENLDESGMPRSRLAEGRLSVFASLAGGPERENATEDAILAATGTPKAPDAARNEPENLPGSISRYVVHKPRIREENKGKEVAEAVFSFTSDFPGFDGHFPGNPIVPGIVLLMAAAYTASWGRPSAVSHIARCKFLRPVTPGETIRVLAHVEGAGNSPRCHATVHVQDAVCAEAAFVLQFTCSGTL